MLSFTITVHTALHIRTASQGVSFAFVQEPAQKAGFFILLLLQIFTMLIFNELNTAFPWYDKKEKQNRYKENGQAVCDYTLNSPGDSLLPFQFRREKVATPPAKWEIKEANSDAQVVDISGNLGLVKAATLDGYDYFYFDGVSLGLTLAAGFYYSQITYANGSAFYSEMFSVCRDPFTVATDKTTKFLRLEWYNTMDLPPFYFADQVLGVPLFRNVVYLDTIITASEPEVVQETEKNGLDEEIIVFQRAVISYLVTALVPDFLKIAMVLIPLHDVVLLTTPGGIRDGEIKNIKTKTDLQENGFLSMVDLTFEQELTLIKRGCPTPLIPDACGSIPAPTLTSAILSAGNVTLTGSVTALNLWVDVYTSATEGGSYALRYAGKAPAALNAGTLVVPAVTGETWFKVRLKNFNCDAGLSGAVTT